MTQGQTIAEKIISSHVETNSPVRAGDMVVAELDTIMAQDGNAPLAIKILREELGGDLRDPKKVVLVIDHCGPSPDQAASNLQKTMRKFVAEQGAQLFDIGSGISHVVLPESGLVGPGRLVIGSDSHTITYGALNCLGTGMGSTDIAVAMATGQTWLRVPETIHVELIGTLPAYATPKDLILTMVDEIGVDGATYKSLEIDGPGLAGIGMDGRLTLCNMGVEMGAKCALMPIDELARAHLDAIEERHPGRLPSDLSGIEADADCDYVATYRFDLAQVEPMVVLPHDLTQVKPASQVERVPIQQAFIGTCTNSRLEDLHAAAAVLEGRQVSQDVRLIVTPGSKDVLQQAMADGTMAKLVEAGAVMTTPGCGACVGTHLGIPADDETVISTANRNFKGRMGNPEARIILGSPETVAASAVLGRLATMEELQ